MLTRRQTYTLPDVETDVVDNFAKSSATDTASQAYKPLPVTDKTISSPARHLQEDLSKMIALQAHNTYAEDKYPVKWTVLGLVAFCSIAWLIVGRLAFGI